MLSLFLLVLAFCTGVLHCRKPNFVFILTDDQDLLLNGMRPMTNVIRLVGGQGKTFINTFANSPICCPSRSTILTGKYPHNTGVFNNSISGNCSSTHFQENHELFSIAALLKRNAYNTFYAGKYLNQYGMKKCGGTKHVPKGYDWWFGLKGNSRYYNYTLSINGTKKYFSNQYLTDVIANFSLDFLRQKYVKEKPFFMMLAPPASHQPFTPADRHKNYFPDVKALRTPSFNYTPINKHWLLQMPPKKLQNKVDILDEIQKHRLQSLLAVDEMVNKIVKKLKKLKIFKNTYIIFMSDNGFHIGQFTLPWDKRQPYDTDIRIPLIISGPKIPKKSIEHTPVSTIDLVPTILDLANVKVENNLSFDGESFKNLLFNKSKKNNTLKFVFVEYFGESNSPSSVDEKCNLKYDLNVSHCSIDQWCKCDDSRNNTYKCVVEFYNNQQNFKYCRFLDNNNFVEAYNSSIDQFELYNIAENLVEKQRKKYEELLDLFEKCSGGNCQQITT